MTHEPSIVGVSLGLHVDGAINFWPDTRDQDGAVLGVMKRIATEMPEPDDVVFERFVSFCEDFIVTNMKPCILEADTDLSVETWLDGTNYTLARKKELNMVWDNFVALRKKDFDVMCHVKWESYVEPKFFRGIYSRSDAFKCFFGPVCAAIGKKMFNMQWFVKYLSSDEKRRRMIKLFDNDFLRIFSNDFTSFEATFTKKLMQIEVFFFEFCLQLVPNREEILDKIRLTKFGVNRLVFRDFDCWLQSKRYSGEMDTSLSNSLVNLLFVCFLLKESGHPPDFYVDKCPPQIEGDDCLGAFVYPLQADLLLKLGAKAKLEFFDSFNEASFCGMVFSSKSLSIIREPISCILDFGVANYKYVGCGVKLKKKLIRAKALSLLYSYPGCPVLKNLAMYGLRVTSDISDRHALAVMLRGESSIYRRNILLKMFNVDFVELMMTPVDPSSRDLMSEKFGLSHADQSAIETYLDSLNRIQPLRCPAIIENCGPKRRDHYYRAVANLSCVDPLLYKRKYRTTSQKETLLGLVSGGNEKLSEF